MAQTYTLDEAAQKLGITQDDLKRRLRDDWKHIRSFRDGSTLRFRAADVDELARTLGAGSDPELSASDVAGALELNQDDSGPRTPTPKPAAKPAGNDDPLLLGDDDVFVLAPEETPKSASGKIAKPAGKSDSDVRLEKQGAKKPPAGDEQESILTEEIQIDLPASSKSGKLTGKSGRLSKGDSSGKLAGGNSGRVNPSASGTRLPSGAPSTGKMPSPPPPEEDSSEFELSLEPSHDSSDEFELSINADSSEDINLGEMPKQSSGNSGINLHNPTDSGPSLEKKKKAKKQETPSDEEIDFELSLDSGSSKKITGGPKTGKAETDSDSEFELTLDDSSELGANLNAETGSFPAEEPKGDIFETDFEIPALDDASGSEVVALEDADTDLESSDFDLALDDSDVQAEDESGSEAVVVDEGSPTARRPVKRRRAAELEEDAGEVDLDDMGLEEGTSASAALRGVSREDVEPDEEEEERVAVAAAPAEWGVLPAVLLLPCVLIMFVGGLMGYEVLHGMWGYHQPNPPASIVVNGVSDLFGMKPESGK